MPASLARRLAALDMLVVADPFLSETAARADVVLPVAQWAEEDGTMTNLEGRVLLRRRAGRRPRACGPTSRSCKAWPSGWVRASTSASTAGETFAELRRASAGGVADYAGISYERIAAEDGVFWPCPARRMRARRGCSSTASPTADGRARFHPGRIPQPGRIAGPRLSRIS